MEIRVFDVRDRGGVNSSRKGKRGTNNVRHPGRRGGRIRRVESP